MLNNKLVYGTQIYLESGDRMPLKDLLYALLLNSANDAAVAIAEHVGSDLPNFVEMMNQRAREIGANQTHFLNSSGLTETGHITTAHDLALIARVAYQNPTFAEYVRTKSQTISRTKPDIPTLMVNENKLLWRDTTVDGIKTGYTAAAQNCLVASVTKDGRQLIGVILKSPGREIYTDMQAMFEFGFTQFKETEEGQVVAQVEILDGNTLVSTLPLKSALTILPQTLKSRVRSNYLSWITGLILMVIVLSLLIRQKIDADRRWRRQMRLTRRGESNSRIT
jgi:D-alanyl-D-alanine carboxypeptidase